MNARSLDRLRKLLALADSPNRHESDAAIVAARRLLERHGLKLHHLAAVDVEIDELLAEVKHLQDEVAAERWRRFAVEDALDQHRAALRKPPPPWQAQDAQIVREHFEAARSADSANR